VVKDFTNTVKEKAVGHEVTKSVTPGQQVVKIVHDALVDMLGGVSEGINLHATPPVPVMMVGLQGSGKTTTSAKIALRLQTRDKKKVLMASLDVQRPAAQEQLEILGQQADVATLEIIKGQSPVDIAKRAMERGRKEGFDVVILDTAGRLSIDDELMAELEAVRDAVDPAETLLVADAMTGQDAVTTAENFDKRVGISGIILTRIDGDARGGAALSMRAVTGKPIKLLGSGEKLEELEDFHPDRVASRILGMGDVVSLVEKAAETVDRDEAEKMARKMQKGKFDLDDFANQLKQMKKMGGMAGMLKMLPGIGKMAKQLDPSQIDDKVFSKQEAIISSMTQKERAHPKLLNASRKKRIAAGSGASVQEVNKLLKQFQELQSVMKRMRKQGMFSMKGLKGMLGGDIPDELQGPNPDDPAAMLGENPFADGGPLSSGGAPGLGGPALPPGLGGMPRGGTKANRKKKRRK